MASATISVPRPAESEHAARCVLGSAHDGDCRVYAAGAAPAQDPERARLVAALRWALRQLPDVPPPDAQSGWTAGAREDYEQNLEASEVILLRATDGGHVEGIPDPADLLPGIFVRVEDATEPAAPAVESGSSSPLHARQYNPSRRDACPSDCGDCNGKGCWLPAEVECLPGCPACAAGLPDPIPEPATLAAPAGSSERAKQLERAGVEVPIGLLTFRSKT